MLGQQQQEPGTLGRRRLDHCDVLRLRRANDVKADFDVVDVAQLAALVVASAAAASRLVGE